MLPPPSISLVQARLDQHAVEEATPCTCGAKDFMQRRKQKRANATTSEAKQVANGTELPQLHRSLWRKIFGVGPKCVCQKRRGSSSARPGLVEIPAEYVGVTRVTVSGKRVPFSREMQQLGRASWTPLDAIDEDE